MKSPLWILTSILALLWLALAIYVLFSLTWVFSPTPLASIRPTVVRENIRKEGLKPKDLAYIYEETDLFRTYRPSSIKLEPFERKIPSAPTPPAPKPVVPQAHPPVQFLDPLPIKISGIIPSTNEAHSQITIINNTTKVSESFGIGDKVLDSYIIQILPKKVIFLRSNGQQETIYLYKEDALKDIEHMQNPAWSEVVQKWDEASYTVNTYTFGEHIHSLADLLETLDVTTVFVKGTSYGCRIGKMNEKSIGFALGFIPGDIITRINGIAPTTTTNRIAIYNDIVEAHTNKQIKVELMRKHTKLAMVYTLEGIAAPEQEEEPVVTPPVENVHEPVPAPLQIPKNPAPEKHKAEEKKEPVTLAHVAQDMKTRDRQALSRYGSRASVLKGLPT